TQNNSSGSYRERHRASGFASQLQIPPRVPVRGTSVLLGVRLENPALSRSLLDMAMGRDTVYGISSTMERCFYSHMIVSHCSTQRDDVLNFLARDRELALHLLASRHYKTKHG